MLVTNIQLPLGIQGNPNISMGTENQEVFQDILFNALNNIVEDIDIVPTIVENVEIPIPDLEEEDFKEMINPFMFLSGYLIQNENLNVEIVNEEIKEIQDTVSIDMDYMSLKGIDLPIQDDPEVITSEIQTVPLIPEDDSLREINHPRIDMTDREFSAERAIIPRKATNDFKVEDILEDYTKQTEKVKDKESLAPKDKDKDLALNDYNQINASVIENMEINQIPKILDEEQVLSKENIQNVNNSIIRLVETTTEGQTSMMKVQLYPEDLGTINVVLKMDEGKIIAKIMVDNDNIKQIFNNKINELSENLIKQNIHMEKVEIELNPNLNLNSNSDFREGFNRNNRNHFKRNQVFSFEKDSIKTVSLEEKNPSGSGAISILA